MNQNVGVIALLGVAAYFLLNRKSGPNYTNANGEVVNAVVCGETVGFDVPGYTRVWLSQLKNGQLNFDGPFDVPMPPYTLNCSTDMGNYEIAVYELNPDDTKANLIGQTTFIVYPAGSGSA